MMKTIICIIIVFLLSFNNVVHADSSNDKLEKYRTLIEKYVQEDKWDLVGHDGESMYFKLQQQYSKGNKIKEVEFDIMTMDLQLKMLKKCYDDNWFIYLPLSLLYPYGKALQGPNRKKIIELTFKVLTKSFK